MKILLVVGKKKTGKTTLVEKLIPALKDKGYRVGSMKYTTEDHEFDTPGKDSYRHTRAGAESTLILSPSKIALFSQSLRNRNLDRILDFVFSDCDVVIGEGFKDSPFPKIEVFDSQKHSGLLCSAEDNLIAVVGDVDPSGGVPYFSPDQTGALIEFIEDRFLNDRRPS
jgi:molybdopterin-guanine dinucleotide biosynthesis protein MobB